MHRIAVLIPVYNVEKYLGRCLDSVLAQTHPDVEVFCCDDGSTDRTLDILNAYSLRDSRVHYTSQANAGANAARNRLLDALPAGFDAFAFLDGDDFIHPRMLAELDEALTRTGSDVAECDSAHVAPDAVEPVEVPPVDPSKWRVIEDMSVYLLRKTAPGTYLYLWNKLYLRSAVGQIRLRPGLTFEDDFFYGYEVNAATRRKVLVPGRYHNYRNNPIGVTSTHDHRKYFEATAESIRLRQEVFLNAGRIPSRLDRAVRSELADDAYRMCIRKNLKKNGDPRLCRELFGAAGAFFVRLERESGFRPIGLSPAQRLGYWACLHGHYAVARICMLLT